MTCTLPTSLLPLPQPRKCDLLSGHPRGPRTPGLHSKNEYIPRVFFSWSGFWSLSTRVYFFHHCIASNMHKYLKHVSGSTYFPRTLTACDCQLWSYGARLPWNTLVTNAIKPFKMKEVLPESCQNILGNEHNISTLFSRCVHPCPMQVTLAMPCLQIVVLNVLIHLFILHKPRLHFKKRKSSSLLHGLCNCICHIHESEML